jgi:membrane-bound metal-dependent hydrolase YbcI (DUF457 family)
VACRGEVDDGLLPVLRRHRGAVMSIILFAIIAFIVCKLLKLDDGSARRPKYLGAGMTRKQRDALRRRK